MSHLRTVQLQIQNVDEQLLRRAVEVVAREKGLRVTDTIQDYYGRSRKVLTGVVGGDECPYGYGVNIKSDGIEAVGDEMQGYGLENFRTHINQSYKAMTYATALAKQGYTPAVALREETFVVVGSKMA